jgi:hypothetical protein
MDTCTSPFAGCGAREVCTGGWKGLEPCVANALCRAPSVVPSVGKHCNMCSSRLLGLEAKRKPGNTNGLETRYFYQMEHMGGSNVRKCHMSCKYVQHVFRAPSAPDLTKSNVNTPEHVSNVKIRIFKNIYNDKLLCMPLEDQIPVLDRPSKRPKAYSHHRRLPHAMRPEFNYATFE